MNAKLLNPLSRDTALKWWYQVPLQPLSGTLPPFEFEVKRPKTHPENYWTGADVELYHQHLINIIATFGVQYELFPAIIRDHQTKQPVLADYHVFRVLEVAPIIDYERSTLLESRSHRRYRVPSINLPADAPFLCRDAHYGRMIFIHPKLRVAIEDATITGCNFLPLEEYVASINLGLPPDG